MTSARSSAPALLDSRPGRAAVTVGDLAELAGPRSGIVELTHRLVWLSPEARRFDLADGYDRMRMYEIVLREAVSADELRAYLNETLLQELWPVLLVPRGVRRAWELRHPRLGTRAHAGRVAG